MGVVVLLYWWGVQALLNVASPGSEARTLDTRWVQEPETHRQKQGNGERHWAFGAVLVYLALACILFGALTWVTYGFWQGGDS